MAKLWKLNWTELRLPQFSPNLDLTFATSDAFATLRFSSSPFYTSSYVVLQKDCKTKMLCSEDFFYSSFRFIYVYTNEIWMELLRGYVSTSHEDPIVTSQNLLGDSVWTGGRCIVFTQSAARAQEQHDEFLVGFLIVSLPPYVVVGLSCDTNHLCSTLTTYLANCNNPNQLE